MSRLSGIGGAPLPDYSIGATVLVVAIALPFFVFTRAEHLHRTGASRPPPVTPTAQTQAAITTPDPTVAALPSPPPQAVSKASPSARPVKPVAVPPPSIPTSPSTPPTSAPTGTP